MAEGRGRGGDTEGSDVVRRKNGNSDGGDAREWPEDGGGGRRDSGAAGDAVVGCTREKEAKEERMVRDGGEESIAKS